ncbi:hypothetical protein PF005_g19529 [Phytophthora fragariae]|uniref:Uncharacterized protein n=2 Tax=Phytophthora TaxID=4783 RepID=A0A6A3E8Z6_9STRA|nr:hypothetical protein PF003_g20831 [Phytophthora fragariae]KAE9308209.1 hypothetical protein PR003_g20796 [Phytophthora rubi]KAE8928787.1 hypothetical protein PF009_g21086 [Phytophthora fragariae]KAE8989132.1 hypothetical protein PF011_g18900 [Phytophthora fragariae]KAE9087877.1 hypothetical protein PF007_g20202 [Phytophthora fragariae]
MRVLILMLSCIVQALDRPRQTRTHSVTRTMMVRLQCSSYIQFIVDTLSFCMQL